MRILGIGLRIYLGDVWLSLRREGHDVRVFGEHPRDTHAFDGLIEPVEDWRAHLDWVGHDGLIVFESIGMAALQDELRRDGFRVIGSSVLGERLENDRPFGQSVLRDLGMRIAPVHPFDTTEDAADWLRRNPGRYVLKYDNSRFSTFIGEHPDGADTLFQLRRYPAGRVVLMSRLEGVEVGVGAYFDGQKFLRPACIDFEHKRFFPGELGEMTGEMGTLAGYDGSERLFAESLDRVAPLLREAGHVGYMNLNTIVNADGIWPLEFTARFGNPGFAVLAPLQRDGWGDLFARMADRGSDRFATHPGWSIAIVLTVPPFPDFSLDCGPEDDPPVFFHTEPTGAEQDHYHLVDVRRADGQLYARRRSGYVMVVEGIGDTVPQAQTAARTRARNVIAPELRWRGDIGDRFLAGDGACLRGWGWLDAS